MDLVKEFKNSVKNPLNFRSLNVIFVITFLVLVVGLSMVAIIFAINGRFSANTACDSTKTTPVHGKVSKNKDVIFKVNFKGNNDCFLDSWFTWNKDNQQIVAWVYNPSGNVTIIEPTSTNSYLKLGADSPLSDGEWRIILKTSSPQQIPFSGEIAIR